MSNARQLLTRLLWLAIGVLIAWYVWRNLGQISRYAMDFDLRFAGLSFVFAVLAYLLNIRVWTRIAEHCGAHAHWMEHARAWSASRLGRYVPGKVATLYLRLERYPADTRVNAGVSLYIELVSSLIAICLFTMLFSTQGALPVDLTWIALLATGLAGLAALTSRRFLSLASTWMPRLRGLIPPDRPGGTRLWLAIVPMQMTVMVLHGTSLYFAIRSISPLAPGALVEITVYYYFAGLAGMLALFAPAGLGVRETVLAGLLKTLIPLEAAVVVVALVRVVTVLAELSISALFYTLAERRTHRR